MRTRANRHWRSDRKRQCGQALSEFLIVALLLLLPLFLLIPVIASIMSQQQDIEIASRYAAWERGVWNRSTPPGPGGGDTLKSDTRIEREIDARIFARDTQIIISGTEQNSVLDPFSRLVDSGESLLNERSDDNEAVGHYSLQRSRETEPSSLTGESDKAFAAFGAFTRFELKREGLIEADVAVELTRLNRLFQLAGVTMDQLELSRTNALFVEGWTGGNREQVEYLVSGLTPQQYLDNSGFAAFQTAAAMQPYGEELSPDILHFGHVDIDPLPPYRIGQQVPQP